MRIVSPQANPTARVICLLDSRRQARLAQIRPREANKQINILYYSTII